MSESTNVKSRRDGKQPPFFPKGRQVVVSALDEISELISGQPVGQEFLIENLHLIQDKYKHLSAAHLAALAELMRLSQAEVYEVATFYHHFDVIKEGETAPAELTVRVCDGIACELAGAQTLYAELAEKTDASVRVIKAPCVGACDSAPIAVAGQRQIKNATPAEVQTAIDGNHITPIIPDYSDFDQYTADEGYKVWRKCLSNELKREDVTTTVDNSGLRGLGGAGFPTARKWGFLANAAKPRLVAVNADEGEPGTFKDRYIMDRDPHRMLEGILIASWAVEAEAAYIYLRDEYPQAREILIKEIARLESENLLGDIKLHLRRGAGAYVCGEESAMLESIEGKRGLPRNRPPFPAQEGLFGRPTLINNVETFYWLRDIVENGADWYQNEGRPHFYSVSGRVNKPGVVKAPAGTTINQLINDYCGGLTDGHSLKGFLPGGASGGILSAEQADVPLDFGTLDEFGCFVGSSAVVIFSDEDDIKDIVRNLIAFMEDESCGQCTPCRVGCEKMANLIEGPDWDQNLIKELSATMVDASICGLGQAAPNPVISAMRFFPEEYK